MAENYVSDDGVNLGEAEERLKEIERQREELQAEKEDWCTKAYSRTGWGRVWRERAEKAEAALANSEAQVRLLRERSGPKAVEAALSQRDQQVRELADELERRAKLNETIREQGGGDECVGEEGADRG